MFKSEKKIFDFLNKSSKYRRYNFLGSGTYFDFVFLCGKKLEPDDNRSFIMREMDKRHRFSLLSEHLYKEFSDLDYDLLTIEEILLAVCSSAILIVESYGSACELGAFSFADSNLDRLWVINNKTFKDDGSFIAEGPIKKLGRKYPSHVVYQEFDADGNIAFNRDAFNMFLNVGNKGGFTNKPIDVDSTTGIATIKDLRFGICLLFDYIRLFGVLVEDSLLKVMMNLYPAKEYLIQFQSGNTIESNKVIIVFNKLLIILAKSGLLLRKKIDGNVYYTVNYETFLKIGKAPNDFSSFIFTSNFFKSINKKEIYKILNIEKQEGFKLWTK